MGNTLSDLDSVFARVPLFRDEAAIREALEDVGDTFPAEMVLRLIDEGGAEMVSRGVVVRVDRRIERAALVAILEGPDAGKAGWMLEGSFTERLDPPSGSGACEQA